MCCCLNLARLKVAEITPDTVQFSEQEAAVEFALTLVMMLKMCQQTIEMSLYLEYLLCEVQIYIYECIIWYI